MGVMERPPGSVRPWSSVRSIVRGFVEAGRARKVIRQRRLDDRRREETFRERNLEEIARSGDVHGSPGWMIRTERTYAPTRDRYRAVNSRLSPRRRLVNSGGDKMGFDRNGYAPAYSQILERWIGGAPTLVELGAFRGSGLALWSDLFPDGHVIGLDVELDHFVENLAALRSRGAFAHGVPPVLRFDAYAPDVDVLGAALSGRTIDIFIDDGPHREEPSCTTAERVRPLLSDRFTYVIEDCDELYGCLPRIFVGCEVRQQAPGLVVITEGLSDRGRTVPTP